MIEALVASPNAANRRFRTRPMSLRQPRADFLEHSLDPDRGSGRRGDRKRPLPHQFGVVAFFIFRLRLGHMAQMGSKGPKVNGARECSREEGGFLFSIAECSAANAGGMSSRFDRP